MAQPESPPGKKQGPGGESEALRDRVTAAIQNGTTPGRQNRGRRWMTVVIEGRHTAFVRGPRSREMLSELRGGRAPLYSATARAWSTTEETARNVIALAERRGFDVYLETYQVIEVRRSAS